MPYNVRSFTAPTRQIDIRSHPRLIRPEQGNQLAPGRPEDPLRELLRLRQADCVETVLDRVAGSGLDLVHDVDVMVVKDSRRAHRFQQVEVARGGCSDDFKP